MVSLIIDLNKMVSTPGPSISSLIMIALPPPIGIENPVLPGYDFWLRSPEYAYRSRFSVCDQDITTRVSSETSCSTMGTTNISSAETKISLYAG